MVQALPLGEIAMKFDQQAPSFRMPFSWPWRGQDVVVFAGREMVWETDPVWGTARLALHRISNTMLHHAWWQLAARAQPWDASLFLDALEVDNVCDTRARDILQGLQAARLVFYDPEYSAWVRRPHKQAPVRAPRPSALVPQGLTTAWRGLRHPESRRSWDWERTGLPQESLQAALPLLLEMGWAAVDNETGEPYRLTKEET